jgi:hypothetical protein
MILADVIFPAPTAAYVASVFFPLAALLALATEFAVYIYFQGNTSKSLLLALVVGVNVFSWCAGILLSALLPSGLVPQLVEAGDHQVQILTTGPQWNTIAILSFFWACFLSFVFEYGLLLLLRKRLPLQRLALCVAAANIASYCVIAATVTVYLLV